MPLAEALEEPVQLDAAKPAPVANMSHVEDPFHPYKTHLGLDTDSVQYMAIGT